MARSLTGRSTGRTNRSYLALAVLLAVLSAGLVYAAISRVGGEDGGGPLSVTTVVVAKEAIPARTELLGSMVELRQVPINARGDLALSSVEEAVGEVTRYPFAANEQILSSKIVTADVPAGGEALSFIIPEGMRAISISTNQVLSAGGLILPGDYVDILGVFDLETQAGDGTETRDTSYVQTILQNVEVLAVAQTIVDMAPVGGEEDGEAISAQSQRARNTEEEPLPEATTVTLLVTPEQAELLFLAETNGILRAVVRGFGDAEEQDVQPITELELVPPDLLLLP
ncbi:MAG: Flp pilus assembly protein CpaB [Dehalococcoidia bacterium]